VQAAIGLLGTACPTASSGFGDGPPATLESPIAVETPVERLWTRRAGRDIIRGATVDEAALRATPMWRDFEALPRPSLLHRRQDRLRARRRPAAISAPRAPCPSTARRRISATWSPPAHRASTSPT
jgi:hypothetical protein